MLLNLMKGLIRFGSIVLYLPLYDDFIVPYVSLSSYDAFFTRLLGNYAHIILLIFLFRLKLDRLVRAWLGKQINGAKNRQTETQLDYLRDRGFVRCR